MESNECPGQLSTSRNSEMFHKVLDLFKSDRRLRITEMSEKVGISIGLCHTIVTEALGMR